MVAEELGLTGLSTDQDRWEAVVRRDRSADGAFYYAVTTTGIYCRPGCPSRLPRHENVRFFDRREEAELAGYRPCRRCRPDVPGAPPPLDRGAEAIVHACRRLEQAERPPTLDDLAKAAGLSPRQFHRRFRELVGVTPKHYAARQQARRFRENLSSARSITEAIHAADFGSTSRAYESSGRRLGMTPSAYRQGGAGLTIRYGIAPCHLGWVVVGHTDRGVCTIQFGDDPSELPGLVRESFPLARVEARPDFSALVQEVLSFIDAPKDGFALPLDIYGTAFQERVWQALHRIPPGATASYADVARHIGRPEAARAVARACAANRLAVAIPCHRVVRTDGGLGGYRWGVQRKQALLNREGEGVSAWREGVSHQRRSVGRCKEQAKRGGSVG